MNINLMQDPPKYWSDALEVFNFTQVVSCPTRVTENTGTLIDHIYTNRPEASVTIMADICPEFNPLFR